MPITHVVLVEWTAELPEADVGSIRSLAQAVSTGVPGVRRLAEGPSVSPEGLEAGFDYGIVIEFEDAGSRDVYLTHPVHLPLARALQASAQRIVVFDLL